MVWLPGPGFFDQKNAIFSKIVLLQKNPIFCLSSQPLGDFKISNCWGREISLPQQLLAKPKICDFSVKSYCSSPNAVAAFYRFFSRLGAEGFSKNTVFCDFSKMALQKC